MVGANQQVFSNTDFSTELLRAKSISTITSNLRKFNLTITDKNKLEI